MNVTRTVTYTSSKPLMVCHLRDILDDLSELDGNQAVVVKATVKPLRHGGQTGGITRLAVTSTYDA